MNKQPAEKTLSVKNRLAENELIAEEVNRFLCNENITDEIRNDFRLVTEEIFTNIVNYAFNDNNEHTITIKLQRTDDCIVFSFIDDGDEYNPLESQDNTMDKTDFCEGGMGLHIIKSLTDTQEYKRIDRHNVLTVTKHYTRHH